MIGSSQSAYGKRYTHANHAGRLLGSLDAMFAKPSRIEVSWQEDLGRGGVAEKCRS